MHDVLRMKEVADSELGKIAEKGLSASNIDTAYKLAKIHYYLCDADDEGYSGRYDGETSGRRHYVRGHYSMSDGRYPRDMYARDGYSGATRNLEEYLDDYTGQLEKMMREANPEEREMISRYIQKIKSM